MSDRVEEFRKEREQLNELLLADGNVNLKRFFGIDSAVYRDGALDGRTKELLGLVASIVLRCDDCITYHAIAAREHGVTDDEFQEVLAVALVVGGSITVPHLRRANKLWKDMDR